MQSKPVVVWLDQVHEGTGTLAEVMEPLLESSRFGELGTKIPPILVVVSGAGRTEYGSWADIVSTRWMYVPLLPRSVLEEIVVDRARSRGFEISADGVAKVMDIKVTRGRGLSVMAEVLQAAKMSGRVITPAGISPPRVKAQSKSSRQALEVRVLEIIREAGGQLTMGELVEQVTRDFTLKGGPTEQPAQSGGWRSAWSCSGP